MTKPSLASLMRLIAALLVDVGASYIIVRLFGEESGNKFLMTAVILLAAWALQIGFAVFNAAKLLAVSALIKDNGTSRAIAATLAKEGFPAPRGFHSANRYLDDISEDESQPTALRLRASFYQGELAGAAHGLGWIRALTFLHDWDNAIQLL